MRPACPKRCPNRRRKRDGLESDEGNGRDAKQQEVLRRARQRLFDRSDSGPRDNDETGELEDHIAPNRLRTAAEDQASE
jgi:hypothetical protein